LSVAAYLVVIVVALLIAAGIWIAIHAVDAGGRLADVRDDIVRVRYDLLTGRDPTADLQQTIDDAKAAQHDTHDPVWFLASWVPPIKTLRGLASTTDTLSTMALPKVVSVGTTVEPAKLRIAPNRIALAPLRAALPDLSAADIALAQARDQVAGLPGGWGLLGDLRRKVLSELTSLSGSVDDATRFARVGPAMLGQHGTRRYFVGIQNNAEARATGGLVAAYAIVTAKHGRIRVAQRGNDSALLNASRPTTTLAADYAAIYGGQLPAQQWITSNMSPDFPVAADIWAHLWEAQSGKHVDGAFGVDPYALEAMVAATGPVRVLGYPGAYNGVNLAPFIERGEYDLFQGPNQSLRKDFVSKVATAVIHKLLSGAGSPQRITSALGRAAGRGDLALWSAHPGEQAQISGTPLAGELPTSGSPFASLSVDSATGTKLDYYLDRSLSYTAGSCSADYRNATITARLTNDAPSGLPPYVRLRGDRQGGTVLRVEKRPINKDFVYFHATAGAALRGATLDGKPTQLSVGTEAGHAVFGLEVTLKPGVARTIVLNLSEPTLAGAATTKVQPMARLQRTRIAVPACG
jgi:hypothetical protein